MYETMGKRAPNSPHIAGAATAVAMTALAGYALANGFGEQIVRALAPPVVLTITDTAEQPDPVEMPELTTTAELTMPTPDWIPPDFVHDDRETIAVKVGPKVIVAPAPTVVATTKAVRVLPKLRSSVDKPPYPPASVRAAEQGTTGLEVCVDAKGRVVSASLKQSSGHGRLDDAALNWVRDARFTPGSVDGAPQAMCGHNVFYEWKLENGRT